MNLLEKELANHSGGRILDVATGVGSFILKLIKAFKEYDEAVGIDLKEEHLEQAREHVREDRVRFEQMDGAQMTYDDDSFDTVAMCAGIHHLSEIEPVLLEMKRVLKPGGLLIVREMFRDRQSKKQLSDVYNHDWAAKIGRLTGESHYPTLKRQEIIDLIEGLDLREYKVKDFACRECDPEKDGKMQDELDDIDKQLAKVKRRPQYDELKEEGKQIRQRILKNGYACATQLDVIAIK